MTLQQTVALSQDAQAVLDNEAYKEAMRRMHTRIDAQLKAVSLREVEDIKLLIQLARCADIFQENLTAMIRAGKDAQHRIDLAAAKEEKPRGRIDKFFNHR